MSAREAPEDGGEALLEGRGLRKVFRSGGGFLGGSGRAVTAVADVSLSLRAGETLALVGESGCGKSTTARLLLRLEEADAGRVLFRGRPLDGMSTRELRDYRRRVQPVFQDPFGSLNPRLTVGDTLREALSVHDIARGEEGRRRAGELLATVGLEPADAARHPHEFSGGQRQRIGIARALAVEPEVLIADEPVSALDVSVQAQILNLLAELRQRLGLSMLFIAHDLAVVRQVADRVAVMYLGRVVETGPTEELFSDPLHPYTRALLAAVPRPRPGAREGRAVLAGEAGGDVPEGGCPFHPRCPHPEKDAACLEAVPALEEKRGGRHARCVKVS